MAETSPKSDNNNETYPEAGLQFTPNIQNADQKTSQSRSTNMGSPPSTLGGESQEIMVGNAGRAILLGDEIDLEMDDNNNNDNRAHPIGAASSPSHSSKGLCPTWLRDSSGKTKGLLSLLAVFLLASVGVMVVGILQLSPSTDNNNAGGGASSSVVESAQNSIIDPTSGSTATSSDEAVSTLATLEPRPSPTGGAGITSTTYSPTQESVTISISNEEVNVLLPSSLEARVPDFSNGLDTAEEEQNWTIIENNLERDIATLLTSTLPRKGYSLLEVRVDSFDGYVIPNNRSIRKRENNEKDDVGIRRILQQNIHRYLESKHSVLYSASVAVDCIQTDCERASRNVDGVVSELSQLEYLQVSYEAEAEDDDNNNNPATTVEEVQAAEVDDTKAPTVAPISANPTKRPVVASVDGDDDDDFSSVATTLTTDNPTASPVTSEPSLPPASDQPTTLAPVGPIPLSDRSDNCNSYTPCERCVGSCNYDEECEEGLLCYQRYGYAFIPGCTGSGRPNQNYCYDPFADGLDEDNLLPMEEGDCDHKDRCDKCRGDCDDDDDCAKNLYCYRRSEFELVPGCAGQGKAGTDYCFDPDDLDGDF